MLIFGLLLTLLPRCAGRTNQEGSSSLSLVVVAYIWRDCPIAELPGQCLALPEILYLLVLDKKELVHLLHLLPHDLDRLLQLLDVLLLGPDHSMALFELLHEAVFDALLRLLIG